MNISIIVPFYQGYEYVDQLLQSIEIAVNRYLDKLSGNVEVIIVNDYPESIAYTDQIFSNKLSYLTVIHNEKNVGIQKTRVNGLKYASHDYIVFLDQDDVLRPNFLINQCNSIKDNDVVISNGIVETEDNSKTIYKTEKSIQYSTKQVGYIIVRNLIVSPGQCLIRKEAIPSFWVNNIMKVNCADDYFLWLLMFNDKCKFGYNNELDYIHKYTGKNLSEDPRRVYQSNQELLNLLRGNGIYSAFKYNYLKRSIEFKYQIKQKNYLLNVILNPDLFIYNCLYQLFWKGM